MSFEILGEFFVMGNFTKLFSCVFILKSNRCDKPCLKMDNNNVIHLILNEAYRLVSAEMKHVSQLCNYVRLQSV